MICERCKHPVDINDATIEPKGHDGTPARYFHVECAAAVYPPPRLDPLAAAVDEAFSV